MLVESLYGAARGLKSISPHLRTFRANTTCPRVAALSRQSLVPPSHDRGEFFLFFPIRGGRLGGLLRRRKRDATWRSASARGNGSGLRSSRRRAVYTPRRGVIRPPRGFADRQPALHRGETVAKSKKVNDFARSNFKLVPVSARQPALHRGTGSCYLRLQNTTKLIISTTYKKQHFWPQKSAKALRDSPIISNRPMRDGKYCQSPATRITPSKNRPKGCYTLGPVRPP